MNTIQHTRNAVSAFRQPTQAFRVLALCAFLALGSLCGSVHAQVPQTINYQGYLTNAGGTPINAPVMMTFRLYNAAQGGSELYKEIQNPINVSNGSFNAVIGAVTPITLPFDVPYWLTVAVNGDPEMGPRQPLASSPYAFRAASLASTATLAGSQLTGSITAATIPVANVVGAVAGPTGPQGPIGLTGATGATGPQGPAGPSSSTPWISATVATAALPNTGYLANNGIALVTFTLPVSPAIGDVIKVTGVGAGGWKIAQNAGQSVVTRGVVGNIGKTWLRSFGASTWTSVASNEDGTMLVGAAIQNYIQISDDSGATWRPVTTTPAGNNWVSVASDLSGGRGIAASPASPLYTGGIGGLTWGPEDSSKNWRSVASSTTFGDRVAAVYGGRLYTTSGFGTTWTARESIRNWIAVTINPDATIMFAAVDGGGIYKSVDQGVNWTILPSTGNRLWRSVAVSWDGSKVVFVENGWIYTSIDYGNTLTLRESARAWTSVASSADGTRLVAVVQGGQIYTSINSGITWTPRDEFRDWRSVTMSADGTRIVAVAYSDYAYRSALTTVPNTTAGVTGSISGGLYDAVELQYLGNSRFIVLNHTGYLSVE